MGISLEQVLHWSNNLHVRWITWLLINDTIDTSISRNMVPISGVGICFKLIKEFHSQAHFKRAMDKIRIHSVLNGTFSVFLFFQFKLLEFESTKLYPANKSWWLGAHYCIKPSIIHVNSFISSNSWQVLFLAPFSSISSFSALTPPCCHNDSNLWSHASCWYVSDYFLAGIGRAFCVIGRKWLMSSLSAAHTSHQKCLLATFQGADR